jgi:hypothetical protein
MSAIDAMTSGQPFTLRYSTTSQFSVRSLPSYRPNLTGDPLAPEATRSVTHYLNSSNVVVPTDPSHPFGNAGRNTERSLAFYNLDLGLQKQFPLPGEGRRFEFRAEAFDLFNHSNFGVPDYTRTNSSFGTITTAFPARMIQFGAKLYF